MHLPAYAMAVNYSEDKRITIIIITEAVCSSGVVGTEEKKEKVRAAIRQSLQNWGNWPGPSYPERTPRPKKTMQMTMGISQWQRTTPIISL